MAERLAGELLDAANNTGAADKDKYLQMADKLCFCSLQNTNIKTVLVLLPKQFSRIYNYSLRGGN